jgi:hypothetical protein
MRVVGDQPHGGRGESGSRRASSVRQTPIDPPLGSTVTWELALVSLDAAFCAEVSRRGSGLFETSQRPSGNKVSRRGLFERLISIISRQERCQEPRKKFSEDYPSRSSISVVSYVLTSSPRPIRPTAAALAAISGKGLSWELPGPEGADHALARSILIAIVSRIHS